MPPKEKILFRSMQRIIGYVECYFFPRAKIFFIWGAKKIKVVYVIRCIKALRVGAIALLKTNPLHASDDK